MDPVCSGVWISLNPVLHYNYMFCPVSFPGTLWGRHPQVKQKDMGRNSPAKMVLGWHAKPELWPERKWVHTEPLRLLGKHSLWKQPTHLTQGRNTSQLLLVLDPVCLPILIFFYWFLVSLTSSKILKHSSISHRRPLLYKSIVFAEVSIHQCSFLISLRYFLYWLHLNTSAAEWTQSIKTFYRYNSGPLFTGSDIGQSAAFN